MIGLLLSLLSLGAGCSNSYSPMNVTIVDVKFIEGRDISLQKGHITGSLIALQSLGAIISKTSVISKLSNGGWFLSARDVTLDVVQCSLTHLKDKFGYFEHGSVHLRSCSFTDCRRPITMEAPQSDTDYVDRETNFVVSSGNCAVEGSTFIRCSVGSGEGGAIKFQGDGLLNLTSCKFQTCTSGNNYGGAVFSSSSKKNLVFNDCQVTDCTSTISVIHLQCGTSAGQFGELMLTGNIFKGNTITTSTEGGKGGGCGLVIRFPLTLSLVDCTFEDCKSTSTDDIVSGGGGVLFKTATGTTYSFVFDNCIFNGTQAARNGGAIVINRASGSAVPTVEIKNCHFESCICTEGDTSGKKGGALYFSNQLTSLSIIDSAFLDCSAAEGGCISAGVIDTFKVNNCTIDSCSATGTELFTLTAEATQADIIELHIEGMSDGRGKLKLTNFGGSQLLLYNCSFNNYATDFLVTYTAAGNICLNLTLCRFTTITSSAASGLLQVQFSNHDLFVSQCQFSGFGVARALIRAGGNSERGKSCVIEQCQFTDMTVSDGVLFDFSCFNGVELSDIDFKTEGDARVFGVMIFNHASTEVSVQSLRFEGVKLTTGREYSLIRFQNGRLTKFDDVRFVSCTSTQYILHLDPACVLDCPITGCVVDKCSCSANVFYVCSTNLRFSMCEIANMALSWPPLKLKLTSKTSLSLSDMSFTSITPSSSAFDLVKFETTTTALTELLIDNITVTGCTCATFMSPPTGDKCTIKGKFTNTQSTRLFLFSEMKQVEISESEFTLCRGQVMQYAHTESAESAVNLSFCDFESCTGTSPILELSGPNLITFNGLSFTKCSGGETSSLVSVTGTRFDLSDCCFRESQAIAGTAAYITATVTAAEFALPMCFDLSQEESVNFGEMKPWESLEKSVFNCEYCEGQPTSESEVDTSDFEPSDTSEVESMTGTDDDPTKDPDDDPTKDPDDDSGNDGLSPGAIAGITIAVLVVIAVVVLLVLLLVMRKSSKKASASDLSGEAQEEAVHETVTLDSMTTSWEAKVTEDTPQFAGHTTNDFDAIFEETGGY